MTNLVLSCMVIALLAALGLALLAWRIAFKSANYWENRAGVWEGAAHHWRSRAELASRHYDELEEKAYLRDKRGRMARASVVLNETSN